MQKTNWKKHLLLEKWHDFKKWQKWPIIIWEGYSKAKWSKMASFEAEIESAKNTQKRL